MEMSSVGFRCQIFFDGLITEVVNLTILLKPVLRTHDFSLSVLTGHDVQVKF